MASLRIPLTTFYEHTPLEIHHALTAYYDEQQALSEGEWERLRVLVYYEYLFVPSKKSKLSYNLFKKEHFPLGFDGDGPSTPIIDDDQFAAIQDYFKDKK